MNKIDVQLNGKWLSEEVPGFTVLSIEGRELLEKDLQTESIKGVDGATFIGSKYPTRTLKIGFFIRALTNEQRGERYNKLASLLSADEQKIIFSDESDKYFIGSVTKSGAKEIQFFCSDPFKYSTTEKSFDLRTDKTFSIKNNGTISVPIRYEISFSADNGFVAVASKDGALELGSRDEADTEATYGDEMLLKWNDFLTASANHNNRTDGTWQYHYPHDMKKVTEKGNGDGAIQRDYLELNTSSGSHSGNWVCGAKRIVNIPDDSNGDSGALDWVIGFYTWFETGQMGQTGEQSIAVLDSNNVTIAEFIIYKTDTSGNEAHVKFETKDGEFKNIPFQANWMSPYGSGNRGFGAITKRDNWIEFYYCGTYYRYFDNGLKTRKASKVRITIGENRCNGKPVTINRIADVDFKKFGVEGSTDVANTFGSGDKLVIDGSVGKSFLNGQHRPDLEILGSSYVKANPGTNEIQIGLSSWFTSTITAKAFIREAWL